MVGKQANIGVFCLIRTLKYVVTYYLMCSRAQIKAEHMSFPQIFVVDNHKKKTISQSCICLAGHQFMLLLTWIPR